MIEHYIAGTEVLNREHAQAFDRGVELWELWRALANTAVKRVRMLVVEHFRSRDVVLDQSISIKG